jgi:Ca-activated chloride channel family protein
VSWPWLLAALVALLAARAALRARNELTTWLGRDPAGFTRPARAAALTVTAFALAGALVLALTTPEQLGALGAGSDVVLVIDTSQSMDVGDVPPTRLRRAVRLAERVVEHAKGERFGLVVFAGEAFIALPLTQDLDAVQTYLRALDSETVSVRGSELGRALELAARTFDPASSRPRTVLLLSDGESFGPSPDAQLSALHSLGAHVVAVGFGTEEGGPVPGQAALGETTSRRGEAALSLRNDGLMSYIAKATDGRYFREIEERPQPLDLLPASAAAATAAEQPAPRDPLLGFVCLAALALAVELLLSGGALRARVLSPRLRTAFASTPARAVTLAALALAGLVAASYLSEGDRALAAGHPDEALALYREAERTRGSDPRVQIRIGNALYRLQRSDQAASEYLDALRTLEPGDSAGRFAASFNLGNALAAKQHFEEARDAYWTALVADPQNAEAKFNYEWAVERIQALPPVPETDPSPTPKRDNQSENDKKQGSESSPSQPQETEVSKERGGLDENEARHWLDTLEEPVNEALRQQVSNAAGNKVRARPGGPTW